MSLMPKRVALDQIATELRLLRLLVENYIYKNHEEVFEAYKADRRVLGEYRG